MDKFIIPHPYSEVGHYESQYNLKEAHDKFLEVILAFDTFCRKHNIKYSIADGTLLGALRHGDFVPWDDDADVMVTREEYNKIREAIKTDDSIHLVKLRFLDRIILPKYEEEGYYIDLFINDEMPQSKFQFKKKKLVTHFLRCYFANGGKLNHRRVNENIVVRAAKNSLGYLMKMFAKIYICGRDVFELNDEKVKLGSNKGSGIYTRFTSRMYETNRRFNKKSYDEGYEDIPFRGARVMAIKNAATFLNEMYGDYTSMPSEEKRKPEHTFNLLLLSEEWGIKRYYKKK